MAPMQVSLSSQRRRSLLTLFARLGYAARGIVHSLVGGLAVLASLSPWDTTTDSRGALLAVMGEPLGWIWLGFLGVGLGLFALWRFAQSIFDADGLGKSLMMLGRRAAYLISAVGNAGMAAFAVSLAFGLAIRSTGGRHSKKAARGLIVTHDWNIIPFPTLPSRALANGDAGDVLEAAMEKVGMTRKANAFATRGEIAEC